MGWLDKELRFSNAQQVTTNSGTGVASTEIIDFNEARNMGVGGTLFAVVLVTTALTDSGSNSAMGVTLQADNDVAFGSVDSSQSLGSFAALSAVGSRLAVAVGIDILNSRYGRLFYLSTNGDLTTGNFTAFLALDIQAWTAYPAGYDIIGP